MPEQEPQTNQPLDRYEIGQIGQATLEQENFNDHGPELSFFERSKLRLGVIGATATLALSGAAAESLARGEEEPPVDPPPTPLPFKQCVGAAKKADVTLKAKSYKVLLAGGTQHGVLPRKFVVRLPNMPSLCEGERSTKTFVVNKGKRTPSPFPIRTKGNKAQKKSGKTNNGPMGTIYCGKGKSMDFDVKHKATYVDETLDRATTRTKTYYKKKFRYSC